MYQIKLQILKMKSSEEKKEIVSGGDMLYLKSQCFILLLLSLILLPAKSYSVVDTDEAKREAWKVEDQIQQEKREAWKREDQIRENQRREDQRREAERQRRADDDRRRAR